MELPYAGAVYPPRDATGARARAHGRTERGLLLFCPNPDFLHNPHPALRRRRARPARGGRGWGPAPRDSHHSSRARPRRRGLRAEEPLPGPLSLPSSSPPSSFPLMMSPPQPRAAQATSLGSRPRPPANRRARREARPERERERGVTGASRGLSLIRLKWVGLAHARAALPGLGVRFDAPDFIIALPKMGGSRDIYNPVSGIEVVGSVPLCASSK